MLKLFEKEFIRKSGGPFCVHCMHFLEKEINHLYEGVTDSKYGRCKKFGERNCVSGLVEYDYAQNCRDDPSKCSQRGIFFSRAFPTSPK